MNIMHLLFSNSYGGAEKIAVDIIKSSPKNIHNIYVSSTGKIEEYLKEKDVEYILLDQITIQSLNHLINKYNIKTVHAHDFRASIMSSLLPNSIKKISHIHQSPPWIHHTRNLKHIIYKMSRSRYNKILVTSQELYNSKLFDHKNVVLLPNYVPVNDNYINNSKKYDFIFVGRLENAKNPFCFIELIQDLRKVKKDISAVMIGDGTLQKEVKKSIKNEDIEYLGFQKDPQYYISQSYFLINTSPTEGFGIASVEAMRLGVPVITKLNGGISEELTDMENGIILGDDKNRNVDKIIKVLDDKTSYEKMKEKSKDFGRNYGNLEKWINKILHIYIN